MEHKQVSWRPEGQNGWYARTGRLQADLCRIRFLEYTPDHKAIYWNWIPAKPNHEEP